MLSVSVWLFVPFTVALLPETMMLFEPLWVRSEMITVSPYAKPEIRFAGVLVMVKDSVAVWPETKATAPVPAAAVLASTSVPASRLMPPVKVLAVLNVTVPAPVSASLPAPALAPLPPEPVWSAIVLYRKSSANCSYP